MASLIKFLTGDLGSEIVKQGMGFIKDRFPAKLSEAEQAAIQMELTRITLEQEQKALAMAHQEQAEFNQRIKDMEGTASDLKTMPLLGPIVLFLRGVQRPFWGFGTFLFDYQWFTGGSTYTEQQQTALIVINMLVLGFLFGERAIKNLEPLIIKVFAKQ